MRKFILIISIVFISSAAYAQQLRYVDTDYILQQMPQFQQAQTKLKQQYSAWKTEIEKEQDEINKLQASLNSERVILTDAKIKEREEQIEAAQQKLRTKTEQKFGVSGELNTFRSNLVKPLQDQIWNAINTIAQKGKIDMVFDKAQGANLIYSNDRYDITDEVIRELGLDKVSPPQDKPKPRQGSTPVNKQDEIKKNK